MEIASAVVGPVVNLLTVHITQKLRNLTSSTERVEEMGKQMKVLEGERTDNKKKMRSNRASRLETPARVPEWLDEVDEIMKKVDQILPARVDSKRPSSTSTPDAEDVQEGSDNFPSNDIGCFDIKKKYRAGRDAFKLTKDIKALIEESKGFDWNGNPIPPGRVDSKRPASTSTSGGNTQIQFESRDKIFNDALKFLQDDDKTRLIALCGMGGVGKTTLMKQLKEAAHHNKMFDWIVVEVIGKTPNLHAIQKSIAAHTGKALTETDETLMATYLLKRFEAISENKEKCLVILDDVWKESKIKLEDIGLAHPMPKGVKLLLTSRDESICRQIAVDAGFVPGVVRVNVLKEGEAQYLFCRIAGISAGNDRDLYQIGCDIVKKCGYLPLAIKIIAATLQGEQTISVWRCTLDRLKINDLDEEVQEIIKISYESLKQEDKAIFLLCGLFPEDSNISIEDLTRYAWGLNLLKQVSDLGKARDRTQTSVSNLKNAYLLMDGDSHHTECVKMHDLALAFVVGTVSKGGDEGRWIIHHDDFSKWSEANNMSQSCQQISLACKGMSGFPSDFKFPDLTLLKLMQGDESLRFPQDFYVGMEKLQVIAFEELVYPVVPTSFQCSTHLRTLCLDECSLMFDLTCIGNLLNLEVLSFAYSGITILPSTFGNLKKLRLLDVTGCFNLVIEDGVLKNMVKLEELYMITWGEKACCFTDNNWNELAERSEHLSALEFEFIGNSAHLKNMSFKKLDRFKLSVGCSFKKVRDNVRTDQVEMHSYENSLRLDTSREELLTSKINELFKKTDALYLQVKDDMNTLEDVDVESPYPRNSSFYNLRVLVVSECADLRYLFTLNVATSLSKLEYLDIFGCPIMEAVIHTENDGSDIIKFSSLNYLRLAELPKLWRFCDNVNVIELPRLVELKLEGLQNLTSIFPSSASSSVSSDIPRVQSFFYGEDATPELRSIKVSECDSLAQLFSCNPFPFLNNLQELKVKSCGKIEALFDIDSGRTGNIGEEVCSSSLRSIKVLRCDSLVNVLPRNPMPLFNHLEELRVEYCASIEVLFNIDMGGVGEIEEPVCSSSLKIINVYSCKSLVKLFSCNAFPLFNNLQELKVKSCDFIQVLYDADSGRTGNIGEEVCSSSLRSITVERCDRLVNLLPRNPMPFLNHLEELTVNKCASVEVIFNMDMRCVGETDEASSSSRLRRIHLRKLGKLREVWRIKDGGRNNIQIHGFEALENIWIERCGRFENIITPATTNIYMRALKDVTICDCGGESERKNEMVESKQDQEIDVVAIPGKELNDDISKVAFPSSYLLHSFHHLHKLQLDDYKGVDVVFEIMSPSSRDLAQDTQQPLIILPYLDELALYRLKRMSHVWKCNWNEFLILQNPQSQSSFHNLTTIRMWGCNSIKYLFSPLMAKLLSNLKRIDITYCDGIEEVVSNRDDEDASIYSHTTTTLFPHFDILELNYLRNLKCIGGAGANCISTDIHDQLKLSQPAWSLCQYAREISITNCDALSSVIPLYTEGQMQKLQVFETQEVNNKSGTETGKSLPRIEYIAMLKLPKLKILKIQGCHLLKHVFTFSTLESLTELEELEIKDCESMEVIVDKEIGEQNTASNVVVFPRLKYLALVDLPTVVGFFLGKNEFTWPTLEKFEISECPQIMVFTYGRSTAPKLNFINTSLGKHSVDCGLSFRVTTTDQAQLPSYESTSSYRPATMERLPWSYHNLIEMDVNYNPSGERKTLFSSDKLLQLQKLETIRFGRCKETEEIFDSQTVEAEIPNLRQVELRYLKSLKYIWKSKQGTVLKFPNLTRLFIYRCDSLEYVLTSSMVGSILQLQELHIKWCSSMKVIVKEEEEWDAIGNGIVEFPNLTRMSIEGCDCLEYVFTCSMVGSILQLQELHISECKSMKAIVKGEEKCDAMGNGIVEFPNLTRLSIKECDSLEYVLTSSMVGSISKLQELTISKCYNMKVIVKGEVEECDAIGNATVEFPCLKSLKLINLYRLEGFCIGKEAFEFPSLDTLKIFACREMRVFTKGDLSAPKLYAISDWGRKYNIHNRLNSLIKNFTK